MCLAIIGRVTQVDKPDSPGAFPTGKAEVMGIIQTVNFGLLPSVAKGDYVLIHAGFAIQKLEPKDAKKRIRLLKIR